ncbi:MAG: hypothetical protein BSOLF_2810 [Candidatus Carbobacillus altaicus]|uniref:Uncharacterized protein n=1 Tax=Candidatus Carbonibacillus altaicus TaxID=2163959 RepID=A0A2R6Y1V6_9BACL|nr:MAG: hypothetical protein BSOLF_2810 [Candidatus Carbobacillus altaicus]
MPVIAAVDFQRVGGKARRRIRFDAKLILFPEAMVARAEAGKAASAYSRSPFGTLMVMALYNDTAAL